jgi:outer membrane protein OmpA-like peptidoglycan-associated protein
MKYLAAAFKKPAPILVGAVILLLLLPIQLPAQDFLARIFKTGKYARYKCSTMGAYNKNRKSRLKQEARYRKSQPLPPGTVTQARPRQTRDLKPPHNQPPVSPPVTLSDNPVGKNTSPPAGPPHKQKGDDPTQSQPPPTLPSEPPSSSSPPRKPFKELTEEQKRQRLKDQEPEIVLPPIRFITAQDEFSVVNMDSFMQAMEYAQQGKVVLIEGHTDDVGSSDSNLKLSMKRAEKIRQLMLSGGVSDDFISVIGYGEDQPLVPNTSTENRAVNRRIEFKIFSVPQ